MLKLVRHRRIMLPSAFMTLAAIVLQLLSPGILYAKPGGPAQPEFSSRPTSVSDDFVDLFTGDFSYSIPLMEIDGFPITLEYNAGITMEQEASWVGLGWDLNLGSIRRQLRGIPDEFNGSDVIVKSKHLKANRTIGISFQPGPEFVGLHPNLKNIPGMMGLFYNNYQGVGFEIGASISVFKGDQPLDLSYNSQSGATYSFFRRQEKEDHFLLGYQGGLNSRQGLSLTGLNLFKESKDPKFKDISGATYIGIPSTQHVSSNFSTTFKFKSGVELPPAIFPNAIYEGYYSEQKIRDSRIEHPAYGYMNLNKYEAGAGMADFVVIKDRPFQAAQPYLPASELTYDNYSFSGTGISGSFRLHRSDAGIVSAPPINAQSTGVNLGLELGVGSGVEVGVNIGMHYSSSKSDSWDLGNTLLNGLLGFQGAQTSIPLFEESYFSVNGEPTQEQTYLNGLFNDSKPSYFPLKRFGQFTQAESIWKSSDGEQVIATPFKAIYRKDRNTSISYLKGSEAKLAGLEKSIRSYPFQVAISSTQNLPHTTVDRVSGYRKEHHISIFNITKKDGSRYVYGIPVYNNFYKEVSFNVGTNLVSSRKLVSYTDKDATVANKKGKDNYYSSTEIPAYTTSHLLTAILSNDYVDYTDNGPTVDDAGNYIKYNYSLVHQNFGWRTPNHTGNHYAAFEPRMTSKEDDNIGHYIYGTKEIWYPHSIETKNYVAIFKLTTRKDAYGVHDESGQLEFSKALMKLSSIELYTRHEFEAKGVNAVPIKVVNFEYDYSLCPNISSNIGTSEIVGGTNLNAGKGKLTLKRISIKNGSSNRGLLSPYTFQYSDLNPSYHRLAIDRWGYYKPLSSSPDNVEYPYVTQDKTLQDLNASAWNLSIIKLPSGGSIEVSYESDSYAYVQNQRAGRMFKIAGVGINSYYNPSAQLTSIFGSHLHVFVELDHELNSNDEFIQSYIEDMEHLYFKSSIDITGNGDHEYVTGYAQILEGGVCPNDSAYGWIRLANFKSGDYQNFGALTINPLTWFALQLTKTSLPEKVYPLNDMDFSGDKVSLARSLLGVIIDFTSLSMGSDATLMGLGYCKLIDKNKSWVRLLEPSQMRLGGGHRVKRIISRDNWASMSKSGHDAHYGKTYTYTAKNETNQLISSGVAAYEPANGSDENTLHQPIFFEQKQSMFYKSLTYVETPLVELAYPTATIGYSKVEVANLVREKVTKHGSGKTVYQFHTAKNYPIQVTQTRMDRKILSPAGGDALSLLTNVDLSMISVSQGHLIYSNNMHGKPLSTFSYSETDAVTPVNGLVYSYYPLGAPVTTIDNQGSVESNRQGREIDLTIHSKKQRAEGGSLVLQAQLDFSVAGIVPILSPSIYAQVGVMSHQFASVSTTKSVRDFARLKSITSWDKGGSQTSEVIGFDQRTGIGVSTRAMNEFRDWEHTTETPAYWHFDRMGAASQNQGAKGLLSIVNGSFTTQVNSGLIKGDKLLIRSLPNTVNPKNRIAWVTDINGVNGQVRTKIDTGLSDGTYIYSIVRSGNKNILSAISSATVSLANPLYGSVLNIEDSVINASASTFTDHTSKSCLGSMNALCNSRSCHLRVDCEYDSRFSNKYAWGERGNWKEEKSYVFFTDRAYYNPGSRNTSRIRHDGIYPDFSSYWLNNGGSWSVGGDPNWIQSSQVGLITFGQEEVENMDALGNYAAVLLGYNQTKVVTAASNSKYSELFADNFEDYEYIVNANNCMPSLRKYLFDFEINPCAPGIGLGPDGDIVPVETPDTTDTTTLLPPNCITQSVVSDGHTGLSSYKVVCNEGANFRFPISNTDSCDDHFTLHSEKEYIVSMWVKYPLVVPTVLNYDLNIVLVLGSSAETAVASGFIIDGWQKFETKFRVPANEPNIELVFNSISVDTIYIDDFRIHPFNSTVVTHVFHPSTLLLMAQLNENNYATFYEYDQELQLARINKETEQGILTVKEFYSNLQKHPPLPKRPKLNGLK